MGCRVIKLMVSDMPSAAAIYPYLQEIDRNGVHTNHGPLVQELEDALGKFQRPAAVVVNGTLALELALRALPKTDAKFVLVPSVTYQATGMAILNAGYTPLICDVHSMTGLLMTIRAAEVVLGDFRPRSVAACVPVCAFGQSLNIRAWEKFVKETGVPVVVDAAGCFFQNTSPEPRIGIVTSLHATKLVGAGEGGSFFSADAEWTNRVRALAMFGTAEQHGTNAKMSEYTAAVALASLQQLPLTGVVLKQIRRLYYERLPGTVEALASDGGVLMCARVAGGRAEFVVRELALRGIEAKQWYAPFLHQHPSILLSRASVGSCPNAEHLSKSFVGLPFHTKLTAADVATVCGALKEISEC